MCELWIGDRWPNLNCFTAKSNRSGAPCLGQECAAMMQEVLSRATSRMFITSCQMTLKTSMIWTYTHFTFVYIIHTLYVSISVYIYIENKRQTRDFLLKAYDFGPSFVDNKKPTKVQTQEAHAAFGRPRLCFQAFTSKDLSNKRWLKRAPSQPFGFSGSHIFYESFQSLNIRCRKILFRNISPAWFLLADNLAEWIGVGEEELSNTGFMGLQATLGGYQEAGKGRDLVIKFIVFPLTSEKFSFK